MSIYSGASSDSILNMYIDGIRSAEFGKDARTSMANAIDRLYSIVLAKLGSPRNGVTRDVINEHINRIRNAVFGEEVRDAFRTAIQLCYSARGISVSGAEQSILNNLINSQLSEDLKNAILQSIVRCCQDVKA